MDIKQAQAKLADISRSTATKNPKTLVYELCSVVSFLLLALEHMGCEVDRLKATQGPITERPRVQPPWPNKPKKPFLKRDTTPSQPQPDTPDVLKNIEGEPLSKMPENTPTSHESEAVDRDVRGTRKGNAGDAE